MGKMHESGFLLPVCFVLLYLLLLSPVFAFCGGFFLSFSLRTRDTKLRSFCVLPFLIQVVVTV